MFGFAQSHIPKDSAGGGLGKVQSVAVVQTNDNDDDDDDL